MSTQPGETRTIIIEKSSTGTILLALVLLAGLVGGLIMFNQYNASESRKNVSIEHAADQIGQAVGKAANKAGDAVDEAAKSAKKEL